MPPINPTDFLPLSVGNSWTFEHRYWGPGEIDSLTSYLAKEVTIQITDEEILEHTYYTFSPMPYDWPPPPDFFLAGKKVRIDEKGALIELVGNAERYLFDFTFSQDADREIALSNDDTTWRISGYISLTNGGIFQDEILLGQFIHIFSNDLEARELYEYHVDVKKAFFRQFYGIDIFDFTIWGPTDDWVLYQNQLFPLYAVINGNRINYSDMGGIDPMTTLISISTWGKLKRRFSP